MVGQNAVKIEPQPATNFSFIATTPMTRSEHRMVLRRFKRHITTNSTDVNASGQADGALANL